MSDKLVKKAQELLKKHHQGHILVFWGQLEDAQKRGLLEQIELLNFRKIDEWVAQYVKGGDYGTVPADFEPAEYYRHTPRGSAQRQKYDRARALGAELISAGKVGAFVVAGGQGTRLGFDGPKGNFPISPVKGKSLFQIFGETIAAVCDKYQTRCPWYVMTSPLNDAQTREIFKANDYYGLDSEDVFIFQQGTLPNFGFDGRILMADKGQIACSPDGHGGSLRALYKSGAVEDMKKRGVELVSYWQVDNCLINIFDPLFIGLHATGAAEMSSKALLKTGPMEKVGNFCLVDGKVTVIEYSDLPDEAAEKRSSDGSLVFELGSIGIHIINRDFVEQLNADGFSLPLHRAVKKIEHINQTGKLITPAVPNGVKLESFVFDAIPLASNSVILETLRSEEFAPAKNATGVDSAESAKAIAVERAAGWLEEAGVKIPKKADGSADCLIEIAPSFALEKEDIRSKLDRIPAIKAGDKVYLG